MIDTEEAARQLDIDRYKVSRLCRKGKIPAEKIKRKWMIKGDIIKKNKLGKYKVMNKKEVKKREKKIKKIAKCNKCIWGKKCGKHTYTCFFRRCVYDN
jgi:excisionase family DNA binding protein